MQKRKNAEIAKKFYEDADTICYRGVKTTGSKLLYRKCPDPIFTEENHYIVVNKDEQKIVDWFNANKLMVKYKDGSDWYEHSYNKLIIDTQEYEYRKENRDAWYYKIIYKEDNLVEQGGSINKSSIYNRLDSLEDGQTITITKLGK